MLRSQPSSGPRAVLVSYLSTSRASRVVSSHFPEFLKKQSPHLFQLCFSDAIPTLDLLACYAQFQNVTRTRSLVWEDRCVGLILQAVSSITSVSTGSRTTVHVGQRVVVTLGVLGLYVAEVEWLGVASWNALSGASGSRGTFARRVVAWRTLGLGELRSLCVEGCILAVREVTTRTALVLVGTGLAAGLTACLAAGWFW